MKILFIFLISSMLLSAQSWFPLHKGNKYQTFGVMTYQGAKYALLYNYEITRDTIIEGKHYSYHYIPMSELAGFPVRYDSVEQKVYYYENGDKFCFDFNTPVGVWITALFPRNLVREISFAGGGMTVFGKWRIFKRLIIYAPLYPYYDFVEDIGYLNNQKGDPIGGYFISGNDTLKYNHNHYPYFSSHTIPDTIRTSLLSFQIRPNHYLTTWYSPPSQSLNYIDFTWCEGYYKKGNDSTSKFIFKRTSSDFWYSYFNINLDSSLINNGYQFYFNIFARDKSIFPHTSALYVNYKKLIYSPVVSVEDKISIKSFSLEQNYPNPFNPSTLIRYSIMNTSLVSLKVFDILGKEISVLVNREQSPGEYSVVFNADKLPSGIYIYRLQSGSSVSTKKMLLIR